MILKEIKLNNFRNYSEQSISFDEKVNVIFGKNGQGKSNLLEGINLLSMGKSFRTPRVSEMIRFGESFFRVSGVFEKRGRDLSLEVMMSLEEKRFKIDGNQCFKNADLLENAYIVVFSPEDLAVVKEEPEKRRRFIDREIFQIRPLYYKDLSKYKKSLIQRNAVMKDEFINEYMLEAWDENLINYGSRVMIERNRFIDKLKRVSSQIHSALTGGNEKLEIVYESSIKASDNLEEQKSIYAAKIREFREKDIARTSTSRGPHKDDLKIYLNETDVRNYGSQGQQRTAALSLKLAEIQIIKDETGEDAIVLLDDVLSELDNERQYFLINSFSNNQIFISTAEISSEMKTFLPEGNTYHVSQGNVLY
jgi:DNA replication and repair protein RecF